MTDLKRSEAILALIAVPQPSSDPELVRTADGVLDRLHVELEADGVSSIRHPLATSEMRQGAIRAVAKDAGTSAVAAVRTWRRDDRSIVLAVELFAGESEKLLYGAGRPWQSSEALLQDTQRGTARRVAEAFRGYVQP